MNSINHGTSPSGEPNNVPEWDENRVALALGRLSKALPSLIRDIVEAYDRFLIDNDVTVCLTCDRVISWTESDRAKAFRETALTPVCEWCYALILDEVTS
jgi:hypothetical protein